MDALVEQLYQEALSTMQNTAVDWQRIIYEFEKIYTSERSQDILTCIANLQNAMDLYDCVDTDTYRAILEVIDPSDLKLVRDTFFGSYQELGAHRDEIIVYPHGSLEAVIENDFREMRILADVPPMVRPFIDYEAIANELRRNGRYVEGHRVYEYDP